MSTSRVATDDLLALADSILRRVPDCDAEVIVTDHDAALSRFANNEIHQNVASRRLHARLRLQSDGKVGVASVNGNVEERVNDLVAAAERARSVAPTSDVPALVAPQGGVDEPAGFASGSADATPHDLAAGVRRIVDAAAAENFLAYGALDVATMRTAIVSTAGMRRSTATTHSGVVTVVRGSNGSGYAARAALDIGNLNMASIATEAVATCARNQGATSVEPGDYEVVLAPYAVTSLLEHLGILGFSGLAVAEDRSFMRPGERLMSHDVTIVDDPQDPEIAPFPFDGEGTTATRVTLIENGVCRDVVQDSVTAQRLGTTSTGHALPMPNPRGPIPRHLAMVGGDSSIDELIGNVRDGLYVTRFWYVRDVHPLRTIITGMTREGTFRIRDGRLAEPVRDLRFTQSIVDALADVRGISRERWLMIAEEESAMLAPAVHVGRFRFSS